MQTLSLPESPAAFAGAGWPDVAPYFEDLASAPLSNDNVEDWLKRWSQLEELIDEAGTLAMVAYTGDTADADKEKAHLRFSTEIFPQAHEQSVRLSKRLLELGYTRPGLETTVARFRTDDRLQDVGAHDHTREQSMLDAPRHVRTLDAAVSADPPDERLTGQSGGRHRRRRWAERKTRHKRVTRFGEIGRDGEIRTPDLLTPSQAR